MCAAGLAACLLLPPGPLAGQELSAAAGGALGAVGGTVVTLAVVTAEARAGRYLFNAGDLGWRLVPIPVGMTGGAVLGYRDGTTLQDAALSGLLGFWAGSTVGVVLGSAIGRTTEDAWSGWIVGGAVGMLAGSVVGILHGETGAPVASTSVVQIVVPVGGS